MSSATITNRIASIRNYSAPLSAKGERAISDIGARIGQARDLGERQLAEIAAPPFDWFEPYLKGVSQEALVGIIQAFPTQMQQVSVNVVWGCEILHCDFCHVPMPKRAKSMPWPWFNELKQSLSGLAQNVTVNEGSLLSDPLREFYDALYDKDFGDVDELLELDFLSTAGFEEGSIGERAAKKIVERRPNVSVRFSFSAANTMFRRLGYEEYVRQMRLAYFTFPGRHHCVLALQRIGEYVDLDSLEREIAGGEIPDSIFLPLYARGMLRGKGYRSRFTGVSDSLGSTGPTQNLMFQPTGEIVYRYHLPDGRARNVPLTQYDKNEGQILLPSLLEPVWPVWFGDFFPHEVAHPASTIESTDVYFSVRFNRQIAPELLRANLIGCASLGVRRLGLEMELCDDFGDGAYRFKAEIPAQYKGEYYFTFSANCGATWHYANNGIEDNRRIY
ncbi:MAG: hypothetical protein ABH823_01940 [bacterium]